MKGPADTEPCRRPARPYAGPLWSRFRNAAGAEDGVSAVEFALLAPMLVFALLATVDVGLALTERMAIDHVLRSGAQSATVAANVSTIDQVLRITAANNFTVAEPGAAGDDTSLALAVERICSCAGQPGTAVDCSTTCSGEAPTQIFYTLAGEKTYSGIVLPQFRLSPSVQVQVR